MQPDHLRGRRYFLQPESRHARSARNLGTHLQEHYNKICPRNFFHPSNSHQTISARVGSATSRVYRTFLSNLPQIGLQKRSLVSQGVALQPVLCSYCRRSSRNGTTSPSLSLAGRLWHRDHETFSWPQGSRRCAVSMATRIFLLTASSRRSNPPYPHDIEDNDIIVIFFIRS